MRAMILAAGLGTRMGPLSNLRAKPALPVLGRPVIAWLLELLAHHGVEETAVNLHHLPRSIENAVNRFAPSGLSVTYSREVTPLGTGGGIASQADFLAQSEPALVLAGDMVLDCDLTTLVAQHRESGADCTLVLQAKCRQNQHFGTLGIDAQGSLRRIADRFDLGGEVRSGVFVGLRILSPSLFRALPDRAPGTAFEDLSDWWAPLLAAGKAKIRCQLLNPEQLQWQPVGTPGEYLTANLSPPHVTFLAEAERAAPGTLILGEERDLVLGAGAQLGQGSRLRRCVVWEKETVPPNFHGRGGVFADGNFYFGDTDPLEGAGQAGNPGRKSNDG